MGSQYYLLLGRGDIPAFVLLGYTNKMLSEQDGSQNVQCEAPGSNTQITRIQYLAVFKILASALRVWSQPRAFGLIEHH